MKELEYPFDSDYIIKKRKSLRRMLLADGRDRLRKKIAVFGGSTTNDIVVYLELFLLDRGIEPEFYQSEYNQYWQDAMYPSEELINFSPDIVYVHTTSRNIVNYPSVSDSKEQVGEKLRTEYLKFEQIWDKITETYHCPII